MKKLTNGDYGGEKMSITFREVAENELLDSSLVEQLPKKCVCGADLVFNDSLSRLKCSNIDCRVPMIKRILGLLDYFEKGLFDFDTVSKLDNELKFNSPYQVLLLINPSKLSTEQLIVLTSIDDCDSKFGKLRQIIYGRKVKLSEIVDMSGVESLANSTERLFRGYDNFEDFYYDLEVGRITFLCEKLGLRNPDSTALAIRVYRDLEAHKDEFIFAENLLDVERNEKETLRFSIGSQIKGFISEGHYFDWVVNKYGNKFNFVLVSSIDKDTDILIRNEGVINSKVSEASKINSAYVEKLISSGEATIQEIESSDSDKELKPLGVKIRVLEPDELTYLLDSLSK